MFSLPSDKRTLPTMSLPIKAASANFTNDPFYLIQTNGYDKRYVVSLREKEKLKSFFAEFINEADELQVRIRDLDKVDDPIEFSGAATPNQLMEIMEKHEDIIYHHGKYDFMLRNPETGEYIAFDEHGLLFIYTDGDYSKTLDTLGTEHRPDEALIYEYDHWHFGLPEGAEKLKALINDLNLEED